MPQYICGVIHQGVDGSGAQNDMEFALNDMEDQMDNYVDDSLAYSTYFPGGYQIQTDGGIPGLDESGYIEDALQELHDANFTQDGDTWLIVDDFETYGYGRGGVMYEPEGSSQTLYGARALYTPEVLLASDPVETFYNFAIHEMGHNFYTDHGDGSYAEIFGDVANVTPMATAYTHAGVDTDTCVSGSGVVPSNFCQDKENYRDDLGWCGNSCTDTCRHTKVMTTCTKNVIESNTPR